ncbi:hypothetical protein vseg_019516 [Gypsophila vaccaria]
MGSYGQDDDLDEYEDDFIDDQDGGVGPSRYGGEYEDGDDEEDEEEEEVEEAPVSEETLKLLKYRQKLKEQLRTKMRKEDGGHFSKSLNQGTRPPLNNFGSFFGPSQPVIADRVVQESKALLETRHLAPKASTSQNNGKKVNAPSVSGVKNGVSRHNGVSRQPPASQVKSKAQIMKQTRDYSFLLSEEADVPKPQNDRGQPKSVASRHDSRPTQGPAPSNNRPSGHSSRNEVNRVEQRKPHRTPQENSTRTAPVRKLASDGRASVSSDSRRQLDVRKQPQPSTKAGTSNGSGSMRPPVARGMPSMKPSSSTDRKIPMEKRPPGASVSGRLPPVSKHSVPNGQRPPVDKSRASGAPRPQDRNTNVQHSRDNRVLKKENVSSSQQMRPPKQSSLRANLDRDHTRVQKPPLRANLDRDHTRVQKPPLRANLDRDHTRMQKPHGQSRVHSQSGSARDSNNRKRRAEEVDDDDDEGDYRSMIRKMFRYNKDKYADVDDDDDDMCMEVGFDTIQKEESRSARIARKEDEEELEKIMEEERQERLRKKAKMRKMSHR